ncbi:MAG: hypothetical protein FIA96_02320 [Betaproteobacteria bacterium]|nr:hypothetical protein [Betaproteobacteria bacterium]
MSSLTKTLEGLASWEGSLDDLTATASELLLDQRTWQGQVLRAPTRSVVVNYRTVGLVSPSLRKRYQWRHLVQLVVACVFVQLGVTRKAVVKRFHSLAPAEIIALLDHPDLQDESATLILGPAAVSLDESRALTMAHEAIPLLAAGLVDHYRRARAGQPLVHDTSVSAWLRAAISRLAGLYVMYSQPVEADGAHTLVARCGQPLRGREWSLPIFDSPEFRFHGIRLLDIASRLPTIECIDLARQIASELDLMEQQAFAQLNSVCDQFASRGNEVYSALREFITRHPITTAAEQRRFLAEGNMQLAAPFLASCYEQVQPHHLVKGALLRCVNCGAPMVASVVADHVSCPVRTCKAYEAPVLRASAREAISEDSLVVKAHIQVYWCGPGQDEIELYDAAVAEPAGLSASLYPGRDKCDISLDGDVVGIDVKSHANPFVLAETLNRSLGGLELFAQKYVAINDQALSRFPGYLEILCRECSRLDVEFISVSTLCRKLKARA